MNRFSALDSFRGICALLVALFHLSAASHFFYLPFVRNAAIFVDFFFVLSGFVLAHAYSHKIQTAEDLKIFLIRRVGRLWPLHIFMLVLFILLETAKWGLITATHIQAGEAPFTGSASIPAIFTNILLIHSLGFHGVETWNGPSWSISTELWVNVIFGLVLLTHSKHSILITIAIMIVSVGALLIFNKGSLGATYDYGIYRCLYGFFSGVIVHRLYERFRTTIMPLPHAVEFTVLTAALVYTSLVHLLPTAMLTPIVFGVVIFIFSREEGAVSKIIKSTAFQYLALRSYSIYLVHSFLLAIMSGTARALSKLFDINLLEQIPYRGHTYQMLAFGNAWQMDLLTLAYLATVIGISAFTYRYVEEPCRIYFNEIARRFGKDKTSA